ncbi:MAG: sugar ABC transporter permease [Oscillospiraceae bacterium]|nr:sugar ABC transporter permease [Oscillospiraceae bacterium]
MTSRANSRSIHRNKLTLRRCESLTGYAFAALPVLGFAVFYIVPFGVTIAKTLSGGAVGFSYVGLSNYVSVLNSEAFRLAAGNTFKFIGVGVPLLLISSLFAALLLNTGIRGVDGFRAAYVLPLVLPAASVIMVFQILFETGGVFNYTLVKLGFDPINFLHSGNAFWVLLLLYIWKNIGYGIILMLGGLTQIPKEYYEAARADGANGYTCLVRITLPLMAPTFIFVTVISIVGAFKSFREAFALAGAYPDKSIYMLQHFMNNNFARLNYPRLSVAAVLTFLVIFAFVLVLFMRRDKGGVLD